MFYRLASRVRSFRFSAVASVALPFIREDPRRMASFRVNSTARTGLSKNNTLEGFEAVELSTFTHIPARVLISLCID